MTGAGRALIWAEVWKQCPHWIRTGPRCRAEHVWGLLWKHTVLPGLTWTPFAAFWKFFRADPLFCTNWTFRVRCTEMGKRLLLKILTQRRTIFLVGKNNRRGTVQQESLFLIFGTSQNYLNNHILNRKSGGVKVSMVPNIQWPWTPAPKSVYSTMWVNILLKTWRTPLSNIIRPEIGLCGTHAQMWRDFRFEIKWKCFRLFRIHKLGYLFKFFYWLKWEFIW